MSRTLLHAGSEIPEFKGAWDNFDKEWVFFLWDNRLKGKQILSSEWVLPAGWSELDSNLNVQVTTDNGDVFTQTTLAFLECPSVADGVYEIANRISVDGTPVIHLERSVKIRVASL